MGELRFEVKVEATGEVRDADGNLISKEPVEAIMHLTAAELKQLGLPVPPHPEED